MLTDGRTGAPGPWDAEREVDADLARTLIRAQCPDLVAVRVEPLGTGWDHTAFLIDDAWVFRFPRRSLGAASLTVEMKVLPALAGRLPLAVPEPIWIGEPCDAFPWSFAGYARLNGRTACDAWRTPLDEPACADTLSAFLAALHGLDPGVADLPPDELRRSDLGYRVPQVLERLEDVAARGLIDDVGRLRSLAAEAEALPPARTTVVVHGDLYARHVLLDADRRPSGIIDWGDVHRGDPALDLSLAWSLLAPESRARLRRAYGDVDDATWARARFRALSHGVVLLLYAAAARDDDLLRSASRGLDFVRID